MYSPHATPGADWWLALLWSAPETVIPPESPEWSASMADHQRFGEKFGEALRGGSALAPPATATTVRLRAGEFELTTNEQVRRFLARRLAEVGGGDRSGTASPA